MHDALTELSELSLYLQRQNITLPEAITQIKRTIKVLVSMCDLPREYVKESSKTIADERFKILNYRAIQRLHRSINLNFSEVLCQI